MLKNFQQHIHIFIKIIDKNSTGNNAPAIDLDISDLPPPDTVLGL